MPPHSCIFCGRRIGPGLVGTLATDEDLHLAATLLSPHIPKADYVCTTHRRHPPTDSSVLLQHKRKQSSGSTELSDSSSLDSVSKRYHTAQILSSLSKQTATVPHKPDATTSTIPEPESSTSSSQSVITTATSMSVRHHTPAERLSSDAHAVSPHERDPTFPLLDDQEFKRNGLPYNKWFEVRKSTVCSGLGLFTRPGVTIESQTHIAYYGGDLLTDDDVQERYGDIEPRYVMFICDNHSRDTRDDMTSLARYINNDPPNNNARIVPCVGDSKAGRYSARFESIGRIGPSTEVLGAYGPSASRAARSHAASISPSRTQGASAPRRSQRTSAVSDPSTMSVPMVRSSALLPTVSMSTSHDDNSDTISTAPSSPLVRPHQLKFVSHSSKDFQQETYEIDHILGHKGDGDDRSYLIRWKGYRPEGDTWEPVSNILTDEVIQDYLSKIDPSSPADSEQADSSTSAVPAPAPRRRT